MRTTTARKFSRIPPYKIPEQGYNNKGAKRIRAVVIRSHPQHREPRW